MGGAVLFLGLAVGGFLLWSTITGSMAEIYKGQGGHYYVAVAITLAVLWLFDQLQKFKRH